MRAGEDLRWHTEPRNFPTRNGIRFKGSIRSRTFACQLGCIVMHAFGLIFFLNHKKKNISFSQLPRLADVLFFSIFVCVCVFERRDGVIEHVNGMWASSPYYSKLPDLICLSWARMWSTYERTTMRWWCLTLAFPFRSKIFVVAVVAAARSTNINNKSAGLALSRTAITIIYLFAAMPKYC